MPTPHDTPELELRGAALRTALRSGDRILAGIITRQTCDDHGIDAMLRMLCASYPDPNAH